MEHILSFYPCLSHLKLTQPIKLNYSFSFASLVISFTHDALLFFSLFLDIIVRGNHFWLTLLHKCFFIVEGLTYTQQFFEKQNVNLPSLLQSEEQILSSTHLISFYLLLWRRDGHVIQLYFWPRTNLQ